jgi:hypothetical protein
MKYYSFYHYKEIRVGFNLVYSKARGTKEEKWQQVAHKTSRSAGLEFLRQ